MGTRNLSVTLAVVIALLAGAAVAQDPADFTSYVEKIRAQGVTDAGKSHLMTVVVIRLGQSTLTFSEDAHTGRYIPSFQSTTCPVPGDDPAKAADWQAELARARDVEFSALKPLADADGSGFVSSEEALSFRSLFEFGALAQSVVGKNGFSSAAISRASGLDEETVNARLSLLDELGKRVATAGLTAFPIVARD